MDVEYDVLARHQHRNRIPRPPSQRDLERRRDSRSTGAEDDDDDIVVHRSRNKKAEKRGFWPDSWKDLIDDAKLEWRVYLASADAFPNRVNAKRELIPDIVGQCLQKYKRAKIRLQDGMLPRYQQQLYALVGRV